MERTEIITLKVDKRTKAKALAKSKKQGTTLSDYGYNLIAADCGTTSYVEQKKKPGRKPGKTAE